MTELHQYDELLAHIAKDILQPGEVIKESDIKALYFIYRMTCTGSSRVTLADMRSSYHENPWRFKKTFRKWVDLLCLEDDTKVNKYYKYVPVDVHKTRKLTDDDKEIIRSLRRGGMSVKSLAARYNVSTNLVWKITQVKKTLDK